MTQRPKGLYVVSQSRVYLLCYFLSFFFHFYLSYVVYATRKQS